MLGSVNAATDAGCAASVGRARGVRDDRNLRLHRGAPWVPDFLADKYLVPNPYELCARIAEIEAAIAGLEG